MVQVLQLLPALQIGVEAGELVAYEIPLVVVGFRRLDDLVPGFMWTWHCPDKGSNILIV